MTVEQLMKEIELGIEDAKADFPDAPETDIIREIALGVTYGHDPAVVAEVRRRLGV